MTTRSSSSRTFTEWVSENELLYAPRCNVIRTLGRETLHGRHDPLVSLACAPELRVMLTLAFVCIRSARREMACRLCHHEALCIASKEMSQAATVYSCQCKHGLYGNGLDCTHDKPASFLQVGKQRTLRERRSFIFLLIFSHTLCRFPLSQIQTPRALTCVYTRQARAHCTS